MTWILKKLGSVETLFLMVGNERKYLEKVNVDTTSTADIKWSAHVLTRWFQRSDAPTTMMSYDPTKESDPVLYTSTLPAPAKPVGTGRPFSKPSVIRASTPNKSSRNGAAIRQIVMHYTTSANAEGTISWFANPASQVSAHYLVGTDGKIWQFCADTEKAWHAAGANNDSIGIEHVAEPGDVMTEVQSRASAALCNFLLSEYRLPLSAVTGHRFLSGGTDCPHSIFGANTVQSMNLWIDRNLTSGVNVEKPKPVSGSVAVLSRTKDTLTGPWSGLTRLDLSIGDEYFLVASGAIGAQNFRKPNDPQSVPGNLEPIPQGKYTIGEIEFVNGKDNYSGTWGDGLGPVWIGLTAQFGDDRNAFGIHIDANISRAVGSAGCVVLEDEKEMKRLVAALREYDPKTLSVEWGL